LTPPTSPADLADRIGAHSVPGRREHELDRTRQRLIGCLVVLVVWTIDWFAGQLDRPRQILVGLDGVYVCASLLYLYALRRDRSPGVVPLYAFLVADPVFLSVVLLLDPHNFAFLSPVVLVVIVASGLRYGVRAMYLSWVAAVTGAALLLASTFWRERLELTLSYGVLLALVPLFFSTLIRRLHSANTMEEDRARLLANQQTIRARSLFLAKVSHELRSPLQGIVSALDILALRHGPQTSDADELIQRIRRSSMLLNTHLRDLLTLANGEAGRLEMRPEPFDARALVESVAASALELARDKHLDLVVDAPDDAVFVIADGARIDQVLTNLVINSLRYTDAGEVKLVLRPYDPDRRILEFVVADTGPGIPGPMLPTLLAPDRTTTGSERRGEGSGIGLAIVRTLVDCLGGTIAVTSRIGEGTTFSISIPAEPVER
jgi:signal transduction histidine kinase